MATLMYSVFVKGGAGWQIVTSSSVAGTIDGDFITAIKIWEQNGLFTVNYSVSTEGGVWLDGANGSIAGLPQNNCHDCRIDRMKVTITAPEFQLSYGVYSPNPGWLFNRNSLLQAGNKGKWIKALMVQLLPI